MKGAIGVRIAIDPARRLGVIDAIEQQQLSRSTVLGKHAEISADAVERLTQREAFPLVTDGAGGVRARLFIQIPCSIPLTERAAHKAVTGEDSVGGVLTAPACKWLQMRL